MKVVHELKTDPAVFEAVASGRKTYEIRKNDREFQVGDILHLRETALSGKDMKNGGALHYTGREILAYVKHILRGPIYGLMDGWCIMSITVIS